MTLTVPLHNLRVAWRRIAHTPALMAGVGVTLALASATAASVGALAHRTLVEPIPLDGIDRVVSLQWRDGSSTSSGFFYRDLLRLAGTAGSPLGQVAASGQRSLPVRIGGTTSAVGVAFVSPAFFDVMNAALQRGRRLSPANREDDEALVAVISDRLWRARAVAVDALSTIDLRVNGTAVPVIGVLQPEFAGLDVSAPVDVWVPLLTAPRLLPPDNYFADVTVDVAGRSYSPTRWLQIVGRLAPGQAIDAASAFASARLTARPFPRAAVHAVPVSDVALPEVIRARVRALVTALAAAVMLLLLAAAANVAGLTAIRHVSRHTELLVRQSLGASPAQLHGLALHEAYALAIVSALLAAVASVAIGPLTSTLLSPAMTRTAASAPAISVAAMLSGVIAATVIVAMATRVLVRWWLGTRLPLAPVIARRAGSVAMDLLIAAQVAAVVSTVTLAALFGQAATGALRLPLGIDVDRVTFAVLNAGGAARGEMISRDCDAQAIAVVARYPAVRQAACGDLPLVSAWLSTLDFVVDDEAVALPRTTILRSGPRYFETLGMRMMDGRAFTIADHDARDVAIVSQVFAERAWPSGSAVGRRIRFEPLKESLQVVGVVADTRQGRRRSDVMPAIYVPVNALTAAPISTALAVRAAASPISAASLQTMLDEIGPPATIAETAQLSSRVRALVAPQIAAATMLLVVSVIAALVAAIGLSAMAGYSAALGARDIGVMRALGADTRAVLWSVFHRVARSAGAGVAIGGVAAATVAWWLGDLVTGDGPWDLASWLGALALIAAAIAGGMLAPVSRAIRITPAAVLRQE